MEKLDNIGQCTNERNMADDLKIELRNYKNDPKTHFMSLLRFALRLKNHTTSESSEIAALKSQLPDIIHKMAWSNICLRGSNAYCGHPVFFGSSSPDPASASRVLSYSGGSKPSSGYSWMVELSEDGDSVYLKNVHLDQYLYATTGTYNLYSSSYRRMDLAPKSKSDAFQWKFIPSDNPVSMLHVQNFEYATYLMTHSCWKRYGGVSIVPLAPSGEIRWSVEVC
jgi:hypothetical protein